MPRLAMAADSLLSSGDRLKLAIQQQMDAVRKAASSAVAWYESQLPLRRHLIHAIMVINIVVATLLFVYHEQIIHLLVVISDKWRGFRFGQAILFALVFFVSFPPLLGFSALSMLTGMVYGFPGGWPLLASSLILGSFCSFLVFRYALHRQATQLASRHDKFRALVEILSENNSLVLLVLIRLCPLPYSLSNGALAAVPDLPAFTYLMASVITSPKLLVHLFVGHKIKNLGVDTTTLSKAIDIVSIVITVIASTVTTYVIYKRMQLRLDEYSVVSNTHQQPIFGNFDGDLDSMELDMNNLTTDDFIIDDEEDEPVA